MARRKVDKQELFAVTEALLLERGYNGFHFGVLSERLGVGRSTIYEYYSSKEQLILVYMQRVMNQIMKECQEWASDPALKRLKGYLAVFMRYSQIHRITQILPMIDRSVSPEVNASIKQLSDSHQTVYSWIVDAIEEAKSEGEIRRDLSTSLIAAMIFSSIQLPDAMRGEQISGDQVFRLLYEGFQLRL